MSGLYITQKKERKTTGHGGWYLAGILALVFLVVLIKQEAIKNALGKLGNAWFLFLTGKTGQIYLDFPTTDDAGAGLKGVLVVLAVLALFLMGYAGWKYWKKSRQNLAGILTGCLLVCGLSLAGSFGIKEAMEQGILKTPSVSYMRDNLAFRLHELRYDHGDSALTEGNLSNVPKRTQSKETVLRITMEHPQKMYLRQMTGEVYTGNAWKPLTEEDRKEGKALFYWLHQSDFFGQNVTGKALGLSADKKMASLKVENLAACQKNAQIPYAMAEDTTFSKDRIGDELEYAKSTKETFQCYIGNKADWYRQAIWLSDHQNEKKVQQYLQKEEAYRRFVYKKDLRLTDSAAQVAEEFLKEEKDKKHSLTEALNLVKKTLTNQLNYNEAVATDNGKQDFFQYTMEQTKNGYDVHYATAATLLLRYLGVPARYVEGYYLSEKDTMQIKAKDAVNVQKKQAHAWAEYYLDGVGWIPFDITPGYTDKKEEEELSKVLSGASGAGGVSTKQYQVNTKTDNRNKQDQKQEKTSNQKPVFRGKKGRNLLLLIPVILLVILLAIGSTLLVKRRKKLLCFYEKVEHMQTKEAVAELYGYSERLTEVCHVQPDEREKEKAAKQNLKARFAGQAMKEESREEMRAYTEHVIHLCKTRKSKWKRFRDHYLYWRYR